MKDYKPRDEELHKYYQTWLMGFTKLAVCLGMCHQNIYYTHALTVGCLRFPGKTRLLRLFRNACTGSFTVKHRQHP